MSRFDVSNFDASELNKAIDDTNFPSSRNNSVTSSKMANGNDSETKSERQSTSSAPITMARTNGIGILNRIHPSPLRSFSDEVFDIPGTPRTPRTSTTPGIPS